MQASSSEFPKSASKMRVCFTYFPSVQALLLHGEHGCVSLDTVNMKVKGKTGKPDGRGPFVADFLVPGRAFNVLLSG